MKRRLVLASIAAMMVGCLGVLAQPQAAKAQNDPFNVTIQPRYACDLPNNSNFLGFPNWYKYLTGMKNPIDPENPSSTDPSINVCRPTLRSPNDIWLVVAAVFEILLRLAGIAAVGYIIYGGFRYMTSQGSPDGINSAKSIITNAIVGLIMTIFAARLVGFVTGRFTGAENNDFFLPNVFATQGTLGIVLNLASQIAGSIAVLFIVIGGLNYVRANGDPAAIKRAKETIIYSLVGLIVVIFASAIVRFVLGRV